VSTSTDCCDSDKNAYPGETAYYTTPTACGASSQSSAPYDYNCNGAEDVQSNGPTDCYGNVVCTLNAAQTGCAPVSLPPDCNGVGTDYHTGACGQTWSFDAENCSFAGDGHGTVFCMGVGNGGSGGTQACR